MAGRRTRGARPPLARSQHFLDASRARELVRRACIAGDEVVVDLGAGTGRLTIELARVARCVIAVEIDPRLAARLRGLGGNVEVVEGDAVEVGLPAEPFRVVANLPFDRTTDVLHHLLDDPATPLVRADVVVAWEVARARGVPWPSSLNDVVWGAFYEVGIARRLPRTDFRPPPRVDAGVLVIRRRREPLIQPEQAAVFRSFAARGFRHGLRAVVPTHSGRPVGDGRATPRELDAHQWAALFRACHRPS